MSNDVQLLNINVGALNNGVRVGPKIVAGWGGITIVGGNVAQATAGTVALNIVDLGTAGTAAEGTLATLGSAVYSVGVPKTFTPTTTPFINEGHYLGVEEKNVGTTATVTTVYVQYLAGK